jgi:hypothetical protein
MDKEYRVKWEIDVIAGSMREAAERAREIQLDHDSTAVVFEVREMGKVETIDLELEFRR